MSILFLSKTSEWCKAAQEFIRTHVPDVLIVEGERDAPFPPEARSWSGDYIISFLSGWVIPELVLKNAKKAAINFHPAPPEYPGTGCYNFAIYDNAAEYGVTCHHMVARVDSGQIIKVLRFPLHAGDSVALLKERSMVHLLSLFQEIAGLIVAGKPLPQSSETWTRKPYTRKELDALCRITPDMADDEIARRIRATHFPGFPGCYVELAGERFVYADERPVPARNPKVTGT
jgi:methionyl-tRNA formyltransferase